MLHFYKIHGDNKAQPFFPIQLQISVFLIQNQTKMVLALEKYFSLHIIVPSVALLFTGNTLVMSLLQIVWNFYNVWKLLKTCHSHPSVNLKAERLLSILCIIMHISIQIQRSLHKEAVLHQHAFVLLCKIYLSELSVLPVNPL